MRFYLIIFLLTFYSSFAQNLTLTIVSITSQDSIPEQRDFKLKYLLKNNTADTLKMFFRSNNFKLSTKNSISNISYYKVYEEETFLDVGSIFTTSAQLRTGFSLNERDSVKTREDVEKKYLKFLSQHYNTNLDSLQSVYKKEGFESLLKIEGQKLHEIARKRKLECQILLPHQQLEFSIDFSWDKMRYYYRDPHEYYLSEGSKHYLEITLVALKEELQEKIDESLYRKLINDPHFIKGVFVSNKMEINLKTN